MPPKPRVIVRFSMSWTVTPGPLDGFVPDGQETTLKVVLEDIVPGWPTERQWKHDDHCQSVGPSGAGAGGPGPAVRGHRPQAGRVLAPHRPGGPGLRDLRRLHAGRTWREPSRSWPCWSLNQFAIYVSFTPLHDAVHESASSNERINNLIGTVSAFIFVPGLSTTIYRILHMEHHRWVGDKRAGPRHLFVDAPKAVLPLVLMPPRSGSGPTGTSPSCGAIRPRKERAMFVLTLAIYVGHPGRLPALAVGRGSSSSSGSSPRRWRRSSWSTSSPTSSTRRRRTGRRRPSRPPSSSRRRPRASSTGWARPTTASTTPCPTSRSTATTACGSWATGCSPGRGSRSGACSGARSTSSFPARPTTRSGRPGWSNGARSAAPASPPSCSRASTSRCPCSPPGVAHRRPPAQRPGPPVLAVQRPR